MPDTLLRFLLSVVMGAVGGTLVIIGYRLTQGVFMTLRTWVVHQFAKRLVNRSIGAQSAQLGEQIMELKKLHELLHGQGTISLPAVSPGDLADLPVNAVIMTAHGDHVHFAVKRDETTWRLMTKHLEAEFEEYSQDGLELMVTVEDFWLVWRGHAAILTDAPDDANAL